MHALRSISLDLPGPTFKMSSDPRLIGYRGIPIREHSTVDCCSAGPSPGRQEYADRQLAGGFCSKHGYWV